MKFAIVSIVIAMVLLNTVNADYHGNGQPNCNTGEQLAIEVFRNSWDPTHYWKCVKLNEPAIQVRCEDGNAFLDSAKKCVPWDDWKWTEPIDINSSL